ncbi:MAG: hypothetical protein E5V36_22655, partial [Mesorhizobium sp.]
IMGGERRLSGGKVPSLSSVIWRTRHMLDASRLSATARSVRRERLTYLSPWRLRRLEMALKEVLKENVPGDIAEFGIALGGKRHHSVQESKPPWTPLSRLRPFRNDTST